MTRLIKTYSTLLFLLFGAVFTLFAQDYSSPGRRNNYADFMSSAMQDDAVGMKLKSSQAIIIKDSIQIGDTISQTKHNLTGTNLNSGISNGRSWVNSDKGWVSLDLAPDSVVACEIMCTYWGGDAGRSAFDVLVEGVKLSTQRLKATLPGQFLKITYSVPLALTRHKAKVTIKFQSKTDSIAGNLYGCQISTSNEPGSYWPLNIHDPSSIVKCGTAYWIYGTGDGILAASSKDMITWKYGPTPFAKWGFPSWIYSYVPAFEGTFWAPECIYMNGKYYMYYSASQWGTKISCIGVVTNATLDPANPAYKWTDLGLVVSSNNGSNYNAIDPAVMRDPQTGKIWLTYGSFNIAGIKVTELDSVTGKIMNISLQTSVCNQWVSTNNYIGEASYMLYHNGFYYLFVNYGGCCSGIASTYYIVAGRSTSPTGPFFDKAGFNLYKTGSASGGTIVMKHNDARGTDDRYYGPGCLGYFVDKGIEYVSFHYYDPNFPFPGQASGGPMLAIAKLKWDATDWPVISFDFLDNGRYKFYNKNSSLYWDKSSAALIQYTQSTVQSQQWDIFTLGTGEYKISNATTPTQFLETTGTDRNGVLQVNTFADAVYQKFRVLKSTNNEVLFYQSKGLRVIEVPNASYSSGVQLGVWWHNDNNCQKWYAARIGDTPNAFNTLIADEDYKIYPNPVLDILNIQNIKEDVRIEIMDISGKIVYSEIVSDNDSKIDVSDFRKGIYNVKISGKIFKKAIKVIKY